MELPIFQVDAFASGPFTGNPAGVCPLEAWLPDALMQGIALEMNLSETAFFVPRPGGGEHDLRWFTPRTEVALCGHATLAAAHVVLSHLRPELQEVRFHSRSGPLAVRRLADGMDGLELDFPADPPRRIDPPPALARALGRVPREVWRGKQDFVLALLPHEAAVRGLRPSWPDFDELEVHGVIATAPGSDADFVSRFFAPRYGIPEDPVTGAAHCVLTPYWAQVLERPRLRARQLSERGGELRVEDRGERVGIAGRAVTFLEGRIRV